MFGKEYKRPSLSKLVAELESELQAYKDYGCPQSSPVDWHAERKELRDQFAEAVKIAVAKNNQISELYKVIDDKHAELKTKCTKVAELELALSEVCKQRNEFEAGNLELRKENARLSEQIDNYLNHPAPNKSTNEFTEIRVISDKISLMLELMRERL